MMPEIARGLMVARATADKSPDLLKKVGIVGLNQNGTILATGFNHTKGIKPPEFDGDRTTERRPFVIHAEIDMITSSCLVARQLNLSISIVVTTLFPCETCMIALAAFGVKTVYYVEIYDKDKGALDVAAFYGIKCEKVELPNE